MNRLERFEKICRLEVVIDEPRVIKLCQQFQDNNPCLSDYTFKIIHSQAELGINSDSRDNNIIRTHPYVIFDPGNREDPRFTWGKYIIGTVDHEMSFYLRNNAIDLVWTIECDWDYLSNDRATRIQKDDLILEMIEAGAWYLVFDTKNTIQVILFPTLCLTDNDHSFHCETGPAFICMDVRRYYWHGVRVNQMIIEQPETITVHEIFGTENLERRRVMIDRYGIDRFMTDSEAKLINQTHFKGRQYALYQRLIERDETISMLKVTNATAEPDGTFKEYLIRVPPEIKQAIAALAWTFGMNATQYKRLYQES